MMREFEMIDLGLISYFIGIKFQRTKKGLNMHQQRYAMGLNFKELRRD
jgi:hypothetical protein